MSVVIALLDREEADRLRFEAYDVLRSYSRRRACECEKPWRSEPGSPYCGWCGKWLVRAAPAWLKRALVALDEIAAPHVPEPMVWPGQWKREHRRDAAEAVERAELAEARLQKQRLRRAA